MKTVLTFIELAWDWSESMHPYNNHVLVLKHESKHFRACHHPNTFVSKETFVVLSKIL